MRSVETQGSNLGALAFSPDGRTLASAADGATIRLWNVPGLTPAGRALETPDLFTFSIAFSPDGRTLAAVGDRYAIRRWDVGTRQRLPGSFTRGWPIVSVAFSPDGRTIASGGRRAMLWNVSTGSGRAMFRGAEDTAAGVRVNGVAFSPDGTRVAGAGEDGSTRLWNVRTRRPERPPISGPAEGLVGVAFSPDGKLVAAFGGDRKLWLLDTTRPQTLMHDEALETVAFDRAGRTLATAARDANVRFWDVRSGRLARTSRVGSSFFFVFASDASKLASGSPKGEVAVWDLKSPDSGSTPLPGHPGQAVVRPRVRLIGRPARFLRGGRDDHALGHRVAAAPGIPPARSSFHGQRHRVQP